MSNYNNNYVENYGNNYGMNHAAPPMRPHFNMKNSIKAFFKNYAKFDGRASRSEYWWLSLASCLVSLVFMIPLFTLGADYKSKTTNGTKSYSFDFNGLGIGLIFLLMVVGLALMIPSISLSIRRLHDSNKSGWFYLVSFIPYVGSIILLVLMCFKSNPEGARFDGKEQPWAPDNHNQNIENNQNRMDNPYGSYENNGNYSYNGDNGVGGYEGSAQEPYPNHEGEGSNLNK